MRRALTAGLGLGLLGLELLLAGCAETGDATASWSASPTMKPAAPVPAAPAPAPAAREAAVPVPQPKPKQVVYLDVAPADAWLETALIESLKPRAGHLEFRRTAGSVPADAPVVSLRHFRWNEDAHTDATRTVTYRRDQVSGHALPDGAVYQVDHLSGRETVGFSFRLTLERGGRKLAESEVGDRISAPWSSCRLARVVEASGAAKAARFVANSDMQAMCAGKPAPKVPETAVIKVAEAFLALPLTGK
jgi:hypothetical protein